MNTEKQPAHTPTPWHLHNSETIDGPKGEWIATVKPILPGARLGEAAANAALIVRAVNSHAALVEALSEVLALYDCGGDFYIPYDVATKRLGRIRAALKLAKQSTT